MNYALRSAAVHDTTGSQAAELNHLHQLMREAFNLEELRELCLDLAIDYEDLGEGMGKSDRILALIYSVVHQGRQQDLLQALVQRRAHVKWPSPLTLRHPLPNVAGAVVAGRTGFAVNVNYGTIVYQEATPRVNLRDVMPRPPRAPRGFIGRARELSQLDQLIAANEPVMVWGPDGIGKSTLIRQAAHSQAARALPNGVLFLEGVDEDGLALGPGDVIQRLFDALFESEPPLKVNVASARTYLSNTRPLVLLDRLSLPGAALDALPDLFPQSPLLLAAAQRPAGHVAELVRLGPLPQSDAVQLLVTKAGLTAGDSDRPELEAIGDLLAGVPLAIVTAANAIRENHLAPGQALARLAAYSPASSDPVEAAVERAYALVYASLSPTEQGMLSIVAALPGVSIDKAWLENVAGGQVAGERLQALELLQANSPRLRLSAGLRPVALRGVDQAAAREQLLAFIRQALAAGRFDLAFCEDELGNILGLMEWAAGQQRWRDVIELGRAIDPCLTLRGLWDAWRNVLDHVLAAGRAAGDRAVEAWALHQLGTREIGLGQSEPAVGYLQRALNLRRELGDTTGAIYTQHNLDFLLPPPPPSSPEIPSLPGGRVPLPKALPLAIVVLAGIVFVAIALLGRSPLFSVAVTPTGLSTAAVIAANTEIPASPTLAPSSTAVTASTRTGTQSGITPTDSVEPTSAPNTTPTVTGTPACRDLLDTATAALPPTTTPDASGMINANYQILPLTSAAGLSLWAVHTVGWNEPARREHFVVIYTCRAGAWRALSQYEIVNRNLEFIVVVSVKQVPIRDDRSIWLEVHSISGANAGCYELIGFDGTTWQQPVSHCAGHVPPHGATDLNGDRQPEVILYGYDFMLQTYTIHQVLTWNNARWRQETFELLPESAPAELRQLNNEAVELAQAGLWQEAEALIGQLDSQDPTVNWNRALISLYAETMGCTGNGPNSLLGTLACGNYPAVLDAMRAYTPAQLFRQEDNPMVEEFFLDTGIYLGLFDPILTATEKAIEHQPDLAAAYFVRGWALYLTDPNGREGLANIEQAAKLDPNEPLFEESMLYLNENLS